MLIDASIGEELREDSCDDDMRDIFALFEEADHDIVIAFYALLEFVFHLPSPFADSRICLRASR